jgi:hypothetical protein
MSSVFFLLFFDETGGGDPYCIYIKILRKEKFYNMVVTGLLLAM